MNAPAQEIRKGRKYDQVIDGARRVFMAEGFEGASVDDIAKAAGVSKATLYSYFPDKRLLFTEVASHQCQLQAQKAIQALDMKQPPEVLLGQIGRQFLGFILSDFGQKMFRICAAESDRFPDLGRKFYASGPKMVHDVIVNYLNAATARGELKISDPDLAADQFAELCKADLWLKMMFNVMDTVSDSDVDRVVDSAVDTFMARYGA